MIRFILGFTFTAIILGSVMATAILISPQLYLVNDIIFSAVVVTSCSFLAGLGTYAFGSNKNG